MMATEGNVKDITIQELFHNAIKNNPNRLIVGEIKGTEAKYVLESALVEQGGLMFTDHNRRRGYLEHTKAHAAEAADSIPENLDQMTKTQVYATLLRLFSDNDK